MGFIAATKSCLRKYIVFSGRASRSEYWWFAVFLALLGFVSMGVDYLAFGPEFWNEGTSGPIEITTSLATFLPSLSVAVRRLHDIGLSGLFLLMPLAMLALAFFAAFSLASTAGAALGVLIGICAVLLFLWWMVKSSDPGPNRFGTNPYDETADIEEVFT